MSRYWFLYFPCCRDVRVSFDKEFEKLHEKHEKELKEIAFENDKALFAKEVLMQNSFQVKLEKIQDEMNDRYEERLASIQEKFNHQLVESGSIIKQFKVENAELKLIAAINLEDDSEEKDFK